MIWLDLQEAIIYVGADALAWMLAAVVAAGAALGLLSAASEFADGSKE